MADRSRSISRYSSRSRPALASPGILWFAAVFVACAVHLGCADERGSTPESRARFVALVRSLEADPLAENANATRQQLRDWIFDVPDIRFKVCPELLSDAVANYRYSREVDLQVTLSGAVLTIEDHRQARNDVAVYTAGVEGALRAYEALVESMPDVKWLALDDLVARRDRGELVDHIGRLAKEKCAKSRTYLLAAPIGAAVGLALALPVAHWFSKRGNATAKNAAFLRGIVLICAAYYLLVGAALHFLEREYDPRYQFMSDYAWGAYGWLMTTTFFVLGLAISAAAIGVRNVHRSSRIARLGFGVLIVGALFVCLAGVFRGFPIHDIASAIAIPSLVVAVSMLSWSFRNAPGWRVIHPPTTLIAVGMFGAVVSMIVDIGMPGLQQRAFLVLLLLWLSIVANRMVGVTADLTSRPYPGA